MTPGTVRIVSQTGLRIGCCRYRHAFRSDELYTELKYVLSELVVPMKELLKRIGAALPSAADPALATQLLGCVRLINRVFYSLNSQVRRTCSRAEQNAIKYCTAPVFR